MTVPTHSPSPARPGRHAAPGFWTGTATAAITLLLGLPTVGATAPVSWHREVTPILKRSCNGCHNPNKMKGQVDTSTYAGLLKAGKHGPNFVAGDSAKSLLVQEISGPKPEMPEEGDPLSADEVALISRWIQEGAKDDTPAEALSTRLKAPPTYTVPPVTTALTVSPDGRWLAISGYHEVFLVDAQTLSLKGRLLGESPRIESLAFSPDSQQLAVAAGAPARFGEIQVWNVAGTNQVHAWRTGTDSTYGVSWSPDGKQLAFGGADKSARVLALPDGRETMKFENHSDWTLQTAWNVDGRRLLSGSRDRALKLINPADGQFIDDINKLLEPVTSMTRHPKEDLALYGGADGGVRLYQMKENQERTAGNNDVNLVREFERQPGAVHSVAFSPVGSRIAVGGVGGEVRLYEAADGKRVGTLAGHGGAVFALGFTPDGQRLLTGGFDGLIRVFNPTDGSLIAVFLPVPLSSPPLTAGR
jgi:WD40 repeat protein